MKIVDTSIYRGPNVYALFPVIRHTLDLGVLEDWPTGRLGSEFVDGLVAALPGLAEHGCSYGEPGGLIRRMREDEGTWLGHVLEHVVLELQGVAGNEVSFGKTRSTGRPGEYDMVYEFEDEYAGVEAGELGLTLIHSLLPRDLRPESLPPVPAPAATSWSRTAAGGFQPWVFSSMIRTRSPTVSMSASSSSLRWI